MPRRGRRRDPSLPRQLEKGPWPTVEQPLRHQAEQDHQLALCASGAATEYLPAVALPECVEELGAARPHYVNLRASRRAHLRTQSNLRAQRVGSEQLKQVNKTIW